MEGRGWISRVDMVEGGRAGLERSFLPPGVLQLGTRAREDIFIYSIYLRYD